jgi:cytochrome P450
MSAVLDRPAVPLAPRLIDAAFLADPYPAYRALREAGPVLWSDEFFGGGWLVTRHADVDALLRDARFSARRVGGWVNQTGAEASVELRGFQQLFARAMIFVDAPDHQRLRRVMNAGFRPAALQRLRPLIERLCAELLEPVDAEAGFDAMTALARPLPARVIAALIGVEAQDVDDFAAWSALLSDFIAAPQPTIEQARAAQTGLLAMSRCFERLLPLRRAAPRDDLSSHLLAAEAAGEIEAGAELLSQCAMLLFAGHETTRNLLGNGLRALLAEPSRWQQLQEQPALLPSAVRELLRHDSPVQYTARRVTTDLLWRGQPMRRGDLVIAMLGAANRDPARYQEPDRLDLARVQGLPLSFGAGPHVCIGAALTQLEAEIAFGQMLRRWPRLRLVDARARWNGNPLYRGLATLPVVSK